MVVREVCIKCGGSGPFRVYWVHYGRYMNKTCRKCESAAVVERQRRRWATDEVFREREAARQRARYNYEVVSDPEGLFVSGVFAGFDFRETLREGGWPEGMVVRRALDRQTYQVVGTALRPVIE